ncbi:MAG TPA: hypothetical protein PK178_12650 [Smithellaceae bacterium]|nr:hypothetical protein [Smithellaceae bacterium]
MPAQQKSKEEREQQKREAEERALLEQQEWIKQLRRGMQKKEAYYMLHSEIAGLYDEMDKLAKKAPNEPVTNLQLKIVNSFIRKAKLLLTGDNIIDEVEIFVSAGDNPEYRDVVTVLRQIRQGFERFKKNEDYIFSSDFKEECSESNLEDEILEDFFLDKDNDKDGITE